MKNLEIATVFDEIAKMLEFLGEDRLPAGPDELLAWLEGRRHAVPA